MLFCRNMPISYFPTVICSLSLFSFCFSLLDIDPMGFEAQWETARCREFISIWSYHKTLNCFGNAAHDLCAHCSHRSLMKSVLCLVHRLFLFFYLLLLSFVYKIKQQTTVVSSHKQAVLLKWIIIFLGFVNMLNILLIKTLKIAKMTI